ncbi:uncharacterized protein LOC141646147 [Silene latifolia]|uniref:uncharacterized protein LOC141646147 n=1 Tax=Silene latifolia TaxID=37657 RepID=UPI003D76D804
MISGLPCGEEPLVWPLAAMRVDSAEARSLVGWNLAAGAAQVPGLVASSYVRDYFGGRVPARVRMDGHMVPPPPCTVEQRARVWLWWFLSSIYLGDKGERLSTKLLPFLSDLSSLGRWDWVTPSFVVLTHYMRAMVYPELMEKGTSPAIVGPGLLLEVWVYSYFSGFAPTRAEDLPRAYLVVRDWVVCRQKSHRSSYDVYRRGVNALSLDSEIEVAGVEPPVFPETLEYTDLVGMTVISEIQSFSEAVTDATLDEWQHVGRRVALSRHVELWRMANRLRATAIEALTGGSGRQRERELAQSQEETAHLLRELEARDAEIAALEATLAELRGR